MPVEVWLNEGIYCDLNTLLYVPSSGELEFKDKDNGEQYQLRNTNDNDHNIRDLIELYHAHQKDIMIELKKEKLKLVKKQNEIYNS